MFQTEQSPTGTSARKIEANRANAQKSTGPASQAGLARSSRNALGHGFCASAATLLAQPNQVLHTLLAGYVEKLRPTDVQEEMFVREAAAADFRIQQLNRVEDGLMAFQMQTEYNKRVDPNSLQNRAARPVACQRCGAPPRVADPDAQAENDPPELSQAGEEMQTLMMGAAWAANAPSFALLVRYQAQAHRDYYKALKQLELLRTGKAGYLPSESAAEQAEPAENQVDQAPPPPMEAPPQPEPVELTVNQTKPTGHVESPELDATAAPFPQKVVPFVGARDVDSGSSKQ